VIFFDQKRHILLSHRGRHSEMRGRERGKLPRGSLDRGRMLRGGGRVCETIAIVVELVPGWSVFEGGKKGHASLALAHAGGGRFWSSLPERGLAPATELTEIGITEVGIATSEQYLYHPLVSILGSTTEWCSAIHIQFVGTNVVPSE